MAALDGIRKVVREACADMEACGGQPPKPLADRAYSGKFVVRMPPEVHRMLAIASAEEGVSLNRLVNARLAG